jgi:phospholipid transport system transporter-binding protein
MSTLPPPAAAALPAGAAALQLARGADGNVRVHGPLTFATARRALALGRESLGASGAQALEIDCSGVTTCDSAGLAVLLEWLGLAKQVGRQLHYTHLPQNLTALAGISELQELLARGV